MLLNSVIIFLYKDNEFLGMIIRSLYQLFYPFKFNFLVLNNLPYEYRNILNIKLGSFIGINKLEYGNNIKEFFFEMNNENILYIDIEENIILNSSNNIIYEKKAIPQTYFKKMEIELIEIFSENIPNKNSHIQKIFYNFILEIFFYFNPNQHLIEGKFDMNLFIKDSLYEIRPLLFYLKNYLYFQNFISDIETYFQSNQNEQNEDIEYFLKNLALKKNGKEFIDFFITNIYHSILISSPPYEILPYIQTNIFNDKIHETMFKHKKSIELYKLTCKYIEKKNLKILNDFTNHKKIIFKFKEYIQNNFNNLLNFMELKQVIHLLIQIMK